MNGESVYFIENEKYGRAVMPKECGLVVVNNSDSMTDYFEEDHGTIAPDHPLYKYFKNAAMAYTLHRAKANVKWLEKRIAKLEGVGDKYAQQALENYTADLAKTKAEIAALEKTENPGQPTAEDFEKVEAYVAELKEKAEAARKAKEEKEHADRLAAINEAKVKTQNTIARAVKMYPVTEGAPVVEVPFSEFVGLYEIIDKKQNTWSVKAADMILGELDMWQHAKRETSDAYGWYEKTDFTIRYTDENGEESTYNGRYDLGDGEGGLLNHIRNFGEWNRTHEQFGAEKATPDETNEILEFVKMLEKAA
jgi:hypothetical protein